MGAAVIAARTAASRSCRRLRENLGAIYCAIVIMVGHGCAATPSASETPTSETQPPCSFGASDGRAVQVELDALLTEPDKYTGQRVRVRGFLMNEKEDHGLYRTQAQAQKPPAGTRSARCNVGALIPPIKALWWESGDTTTIPCNRRRVWIEGVFDPCEDGHMSLFAGGLREVNFVASE